MSKSRLKSRHKLTISKIINGNRNNFANHFQKNIRLVDEKNLIPIQTHPKRATNVGKR